jgi:hypothetical protein
MMVKARGLDTDLFGERAKVQSAVAVRLRDLCRGSQDFVTGMCARTCLVCHKSVLDKDE